VDLWALWAWHEPPGKHASVQVTIGKSEGKKEWEARIVTDAPHVSPATEVAVVAVSQPMLTSQTLLGRPREPGSAGQSGRVS
jgi:hypothetical protein